ncbi:hypothetical protein KEM55_001315, partial [Ascosphaera atra]
MFLKPSKPTSQTVPDTSPASPQNLVIEVIFAAYIFLFCLCAPGVVLYLRNRWRGWRSTSGAREGQTSMATVSDDGRSEVSSYGYGYKEVPQRSSSDEKQREEHECDRYDCESNATTSRRPSSYSLVSDTDGISDFDFDDDEDDATICGDQDEIVDGGQDTPTIQYTNPFSGQRTREQWCVLPGPGPGPADAWKREDEEFR